MTTPTPAEALDLARESLQDAVAGHQGAREASDAARAALAELEAAADRGEDVDTADYTRAKAALSLASRRTAALANQVTETQEAVDAAQEAADAAHLRALVAQIPDPTRAREKVARATREYRAALAAQRDAVAAVHAAARGLPDIPHRPEVMGLPPAPGTGWPCYTSTGVDGVRLGARIGHLVVDGQRVAPAEDELAS